MPIENKKITDYSFDPMNLNKGSEFGNSLLEKSIREVGLGRSVLADKNGVLIAGNKTLQKASELGFNDVLEVETDGKTLVVVKRTDLDINSEMGAKAKILDNTVSLHNYVEDAIVAEAICETYDLEPYNYGLEGKDEADNLYSRKIESPIYEVKGEAPPIKDLYKSEKTEELIKEIGAAAIPPEIKDFLIKAASRHTVFHYEKIADYYAHAPKEVQELMEKSALVLIDFNQAIEGGFVRLVDSIKNQYLNDYEEEQTEDE